MRLVQVTIPTGKRETVLSILDDEGIDYVVTDESSGREYTAVAYFPLPTNAVEPILETLREAGLEREAYTVVLKAETVESERFEALRFDRFGLQNDRVGLPFEPGLPQRLEDGLDGVRGQREVRDRGVLPAAGLVGDDVVDPLVVEDREHGLAFAGRDRHLDEAHAVTVAVRANKPNCWAPVRRNCRAPSRRSRW